MLVKYGFVKMWKVHAYLLYYIFLIYFFYFCTVQKKLVNFLWTVSLSLSRVIVFQKRVMARKASSFPPLTSKKLEVFVCALKNHSVCSGGGGGLVQLEVLYICHFHRRFHHFFFSLSLVLISAAISWRVLSITEVITLASTAT